MIIENIVCLIVGILIGYTGMYVAGYKLPRIKELRNYDCERRIRSLHEELRKTKHALWMARAERARTESSNYCYSAVNAHTIHDYNTESKFEVKALRWKWVERKCREKAKEFE